MTHSRQLPLVLAALGLGAGLAVTSCSRGGDGGSVDSSVEIPFRTDARLEIVRDRESYLSIDIEIADTDSARIRGMMQRKGFPELSGMLFVFPVEETQSFWMANTPVALDIIFADTDSTIVSIHRYTKPLSPENVVSDEPARFVLEVPAGFADSYGIIESDRLRWPVE